MPENVAAVKQTAISALVNTILGGFSYIGVKDS